MKLIATPKRSTSDRAIGQGMEMALTVFVFFGLGFFVDRWLGTTPIAMIITTLVGAVGVFAKMRYAYEEQMRELDRQRLASRPQSERGDRSAGVR